MPKMTPSEAKHASIIAFKSLPQTTIEGLIKSNDLPPDKQVDVFRQEFQNIRHALICPSCQSIDTLHSKGVARERYYYLHCRECKKSLAYLAVKNTFIKNGVNEHQNDVSKLESALRSSPLKENDSSSEAEELQFKRKKLNNITTNILRSPTTSYILENIEEKEKPTIHFSSSEDDICNTEEEYQEKENNLKVENNEYKRLREQIKNEILDELEVIMSEKDELISRLKKRIFELENKERRIETVQEDKNVQLPWNVVARNKNKNIENKKKENNNKIEKKEKIKNQNKFDILMKIDKDTGKPVEKTIDECIDYLVGVGRPEATKLTNIVVEGLKAASVGNIRRNINKISKIPKREIFNIAFPAQSTGIITVNTRYAETLVECMNSLREGLIFKQDEGYSPSIMKDPKLSDDERKLKAAEIYKKIITKDLQREYIPKPLKRFWNIELGKINRILNPIQKADNLTPQPGTDKTNNVKTEMQYDADAGSSSEF